MSTVIRESKNCNGMAVSFIRKSAIIWMSMREFMWSIIHERIYSMRQQHFCRIVRAIEFSNHMQRGWTTV